MTARFAQAVTAIERRVILLAYPLANRPEPSSLWSELHPRSRMRWAWAAEADGRIRALADAPLFARELMKVFASIRAAGGSSSASRARAVRSSDR